jgi:cellobiose phosphorylase
VQYQVNICALGKDMSGSGSLGFRDVAQQVEQCLVWNPEDCRSRILLIMSHMFPDGRAPRFFSVPQPGQLSRMSIPDYIDMGIWMINAIDYYLRYTGDYSILDEICGYYEIVSESGPVLKISDQKDSLLCHMIAVVDRLVRNIASDSNCVRMRYADWNDSIDSLGNTTDPGQKFGTGVSVMATLQAYQNLVMMTQIFRVIGGYEEKLAFYEQAMETIKNGVFTNAIVEKEGEHRILHGWGDKRSFLVGSFCDIDGLFRNFVI